MNQRSCLLSDFLTLSLGTLLNSGYAAVLYDCDISNDASKVGTLKGPGCAGCLGALAGVCGCGSLFVLVQAGDPFFFRLPGLLGRWVEAGHELDALL